MGFAVLATAFFFSVFLLFLLLLIQFFNFGKRHCRVLNILGGCWFAAYFTFLLTGTGPKSSFVYPPAETSPYKLPWKAGVERFVAQGNRSFVSHRDAHLYAFDFWMPVGTEILASRDGKVTKVEVDREGIGLKSNFVEILHADGTLAVYTHIKKDGSTVKLGDEVRQGQLIAYSGMVGQTLFPHLHFVVMGADGKGSIPITFSDVPGGVPQAGRSYVSGK